MEPMASLANAMRKFTREPRVIQAQAGIQVCFAAQGKRLRVGARHAVPLQSLGTGHAPGKGQNHAQDLSFLLCAIPRMWYAVSQRQRINRDCPDCGTMRLTQGLSGGTISEIISLYTSQYAAPHLG